MNLTPKERERLTVFVAAEIARRRKDRGVALNHPEAVAYISDWVIEGARDGTPVAELRADASQLLGREDVMEGVPEMIPMIQVEPVFPDGTKLVTVHDPIRTDRVTGLDAADGNGGGDVDGGDDQPPDVEEGLDAEERSDGESPSDAEERPDGGAEA